MKRREGRGGEEEIEGGRKGRKGKRRFCSLLAYKSFEGRGHIYLLTIRMPMSSTVNPHYNQLLNQEIILQTDSQSHQTFLSFPGLCSYPKGSVRLRCGDTMTNMLSRGLGRCSLGRSAQAWDLSPFLAAA